MSALEIILSALVLLSLVIQVRLYRQLRQLRLDQRDAEGRVRRIGGELSALTKASTGAGDHLVKVEQQIRRLLERQDQWELQQGSNRPYEQAIQMAHKGASVDDLVTRCGLSRGEAELVSVLHRIKQAS